MSDERQPYRAFQTEADYQKHIARVLGPRIAREQAKTEAALERIRGLEEEVEELRRELYAGGSFAGPRDEDAIRDLLRG